MQLVKFFNFRAHAQKQSEISKQIQSIEASFDEQLPCDKQYNAVSNDINEFMRVQKCTCKVPTIDGIFQCQYGCLCDKNRKTCGVTCACEGTCIPNTFLHMPELNIRLGIGGDELYAEEDIDPGRLAYVFTGKMNSLHQHQKNMKDKQPDLYSISGSWQGGEGIDEALGKCIVVPAFVVDPFKEVAGFVNHSCDPNTEVYEIWQNGKLYIVGKTIEYCFRGDTLTFDYNWIYNDDVKYAEICLCGSNKCQAFIAKASFDVMQRSVLHYVGVLHEIETHNISESQRLKKLESVLRNNKTLTTGEKEEVEHLKHDNEELRLTKRKAIYLKKGILMAKEKLTKIQIEEKHNQLSEASFSHNQTLPDFDDEINTLHKSRSLDGHKIDISTFSKNSKKHCILECRVAQGLKKGNLPIYVKMPLAIKANEQSVLMGEKDVDKSLKETKPSNIKSENNSSFLQLPTCVSVSCLSPPRYSPTRKENDQSSSSIPHLSQDDLTMNLGQTSSTNEKINNDGEHTKDWQKLKSQKSTTTHRIKTIEETNELDSTIKKENQTKDKAEASSIRLNIGDLPKNIEGWGEGLFTQDEIKRIYKWIDGTLHLKGRNKFQPWPKAKEWSFWLHKTCRHPTIDELENHTKTWIGISTKTLRASNSGKAVISSTLPLVRDVNTILSDVLTFIPFRFSGLSVIESTKSGNIWRFVWTQSDKPLPGNPTLRTPD